jgi:amino acid permease
MTKANFGLGVLAIPSVFNKLGLVPGIIAIIGIQIIYTWAALTIGPFKLRHPEVFSVADAALVFGGRWAKEVFNVIFVICESDYTCA